MDTLSSSVSTFKIPTTLHPKPHQYFKNHIPQQPPLFPKTSKLSNKTTILASPFLNTTTSSQPPLPLKQSSNTQLTHNKPATGYAVALLDIARQHNAVQPVQRDVKRLSKYLHNEQLNAIMTNPYVEKKEKGDILKELVRKGKFDKHLVKLVNLLVEKSKVEMVSEVLVEFGRIYDELSFSISSSSDNNNTQMVLVPSGMKKMEQNQVLEIAKSVQKLTGAMKVKVRQALVHEKLPSFAV